ncbi:hypothetical protein Golob_001912 [Gossypium lobatum]|uniref:Uncharacterized protein n=1 Tax=Gossypium lobatum TaxID=34289 RepID=A0A7J8N3D3_9ROSI|nr:hypothetical protein [Gossypium lobatum]
MLDIDLFCSSLTFIYKCFFSGNGFEAIARTVGHLSKSAEVMKLVNNLMKAPRMAATMQEFSKEMTKVILKFVIMGMPESLFFSSVKWDMDSDLRGLKEPDCCTICNLTKSMNVPFKTDKRPKWHAGVIEEIVNDAVDTALDSEDIEEETEEEVNKVLSEIAGETAAQLPEAVRKERARVPTQRETTSHQEEAIAEGADDEEELEEIRARLARVRS